MKMVGIVAVGGLILSAAACGKAPEKSTTSGSGTATKACMVTDTGGIDDKSFNSSAWKGMQDAHTANSKISVQYVQSKAETDYEPNLSGFVGQNCDVIVAVGGLMGDATTKVATANPNTKFVIVDGSIALPNVYSAQFDTAQAGYLAGYLAAGMSKSGKVGTYGGLNIPPVTVFMDGFVDGVAKYNEVKGKTVQVLGWNKQTQAGSFVPGNNPFGDTDGGKSISTAMVAQGADIIMPVAGFSGQGTAQQALDSNGALKVIWVDQDGCVSAEKFCSVFLSTVVKNISDAVKAAVSKVADGSFKGGSGSIGTLENNGVQLAPFHNFDSQVPADLKSELDQLKADIISGKIKVTSKSQPVQPSAPAGAPSPTKS
jgi:basic membrane protein A and related proteins